MQLYTYQQKYLSQMPDDVIMHADLGTGKTAMSLVHWKQRNKLLVVAPASKIRTGDWQEEAVAWLGQELAEQITYISYESLRLMDKDTRRPRWWKYTAARNGGMVYDIICDEVHAVKNPQSKQAKAVLEIYLSGGQFIGLSGTPMSNGWIDFAGYSKLFGYTKGITEFKKKYCNINDYAGFPRIVGYFNTDEMQHQWHLISRSLTREQATELPSRQFIGKTVQLSPKEQKDYYNAKILRTTKYGELLDNPSLLLNYLRQIGVASRLDILSGILDDTTENIVVFYNYVSERKAILEYIAKHHKDKKVLRYDGEKHDKLPASNANIKNTVLVAHYRSGSTGLNLQWASVMVFFDLTYSFQDFEQCQGRIWRHGQKKKCVYYLFKVKNTVDEDVWGCLKNKKSFSEKLWYNDSYGQKDV